MLLELLLGSGLSLTAAHLYRRSSRRVHSDVAGGLKRAASLLVALPAPTTVKVLSQLQEPEMSLLTHAMHKLRKTSEQKRGQICLRTLREVFSEMEAPPSDHIRAWVSLANADPQLAAQICLKVFDQIRP